MAKFDSCVSLSPQFQRSVRIDLDWGNEGALRGYLCQASAAHTLLAMAGHLGSGQQAAFTWTGPYGGGKSSLALMLGTLLGGEPSLRRIARDALGPELVAKVTKQLRVPSAGRNARTWNVVRVQGSRTDINSEIARALAAAGIPRVGKRLGDSPDGARIIKVLADLAELPQYGGLLLQVDELGKFLEHVAGNAGDIHFFQDLAEVASRSKGRLVVVGILHQAFEQYATRLGREARDEWAKIQGRFVDIPLVAAVDEVIELTARAISTTKKHPQTKDIARIVGKAILKNRPSTAKNVADRLDSCWPLHPVTAALLGPVSKRRFGQNERSTFAFLGSFEPLGFREFLATTDAADSNSYEPARYWNYLKTNLEPSILASPDGHRWAQAAESVARAESRGDGLRVRVMKSVALVDLFRNESGIAASREVIEACVTDASSQEVEAALADLTDWSVIVYRKHLDAYGVFEGSDFDIDAAINRQLGQAPALDVARLERLASLQPILPKRHYHNTGALRWYEFALATPDTLSAEVDTFEQGSGSVGKFILVIPDEEQTQRKHRSLCKEASLRRDDYPMVVGLSSNFEILRTLGRELVAVESLWATHPELAGDAVARKELQARTATIAAKLQDEFSIARDTAEWYVKGDKCVVSSARDLHKLASELADWHFRAAPPIHSELVNRHNVSSNAQAAINLLVVAMVTNPSQFALGIEGYPAERGLYETVFFVTGLHQELALNEFHFVCPKLGTRNESFLPLWQAADELLNDPTRVVSLAELTMLWSQPPFGIASGLSGLLSLAYIISNRSNIAIYHDGVYQPDIQEVFAHEVVRDPSVIGLRRVVAAEEQDQLLRTMAAAISRATGDPCEPQPLTIGRALVKFVFALPGWTRRTSHISGPAAKLRATLLAAADPQKLVYVDIPNLSADFRTHDIDEFLSKQLGELSAAYPTMLSSIKEKFLRALGAHDVSLGALREKAEVVRGLTGDLRIEALANRLASYDGSTEATEGLLGLAANKPPRDWMDLDVDAAALSLAELALKFRNAEVFAAVKGRRPSRLAFGLVIGTGEAGQTAAQSIDVGIDEMRPVETIAEEVTQLIARCGQEPRIALAALARVGANLISQIKKE